MKFELLNNLFPFQNWHFPQACWSIKKNVLLETSHLPKSMLQNPWMCGQWRTRRPSQYIPANSFNGINPTMGTCKNRKKCQYKARLKMLKEGSFSWFPCSTKLPKEEEDLKMEIPRPAGKMNQNSFSGFLVSDQSLLPMNSGVDPPLHFCCLCFPCFHWYPVKLPKVLLAFWVSWVFLGFW